MLTYVKEEKLKENPMDEEGIMTKALGERRGWKRGIGRKLDGGSSSSQMPEPPRKKKRSIEDRLESFVNKLSSTLAQHGITPPTLSDEDEENREDSEGDEFVRSDGDGDSEGDDF